MKIKVLAVGPLMENCYIVYDETSLEAIIIDPGDESDRILKNIEGLGLKVKYIVNTHGHADHIGANEDLLKVLKCKLVIHSGDESMLGDSNLNLSATGYMGREINSPDADIIVKEGDIIAFGNIELKVICTPGHTPGGICLLGDNVLFSGDSLFAGSIGRTDFPGGSLESLVSSLKEKILVLNPEIKVYPGHGSPTTIAYEIKNNPFLV